MPPEGDPTPQSKGGIDPNFQGQVQALKELHKGIFQGFGPLSTWIWLIPNKGGWSGNTRDNGGMGEAFKRDRANQDYVDAIKDPDSPGVEGDLQRSAIQVDYLAQMERAFRARHLSTRPRMMAHALGRIKAHGSPKGALVQLALEFVREIDKQAKA